MFLVCAHITYGMYLAIPLEPPESFTFLYTISVPWIISWWFISDSRKRGVAWAFDIGMFVFMAWPLITPYYLIKTRQGKGVLMILAFIAVYVGAQVVGAMLYVLLS